MGKLWIRILLGTASVAGAVLTVASQVPASTATSNIASYLKLIGFSHISAPIEDRRFDHTIWIIGSSLLYIAGLILLYMIGGRIGAFVWRTSEHGRPKFGKRIYLSPKVTLNTLKDIYAKKTDIEGRLLSNRYAGKWVKLRGEFRNVTVWSDNCSIDMGKSSLTYSLYISFKLKWKGQLETLQIGQEIALTGWLGRPGRYRASVFDCELIRLSEADDAIRL